MQNLKSYIKIRLIIILLIISTMFIPDSIYNNLKDYYIILKDIVIQNEDIIPNEIFNKLKDIDKQLIEIDNKKEKDKEKDKEKESIL